MNNMLPANELVQSLLKFEDLARIAHKIKVYCKYPPLMDT